MVEGRRIFTGIDRLDIRGKIPESVQALVCDSRAVKPGDLFVALRGTAADGHTFLPSVEKQGACAAVVESWGDVSIPQVRVRDTLAALPRIAANFYNHPARSLWIVGVTGSNGKTTCTYLLKQIWKAASRAMAVIGTIEYRYGDVRAEALNTTPMPHDMQRILRDVKDRGIDETVMEVSSHGLALHRVDGIEFNAALFTNLSQDHLDFHQTMDAYRDTKKRLFTEFLEPGGIAVINIDDETGRRFCREIEDRNIVTYAIDRQADVCARDVELRINGTSFVLEFSNGECLTIQTRLVGRYNVANILGAAAMAWACGVPLESIRQGIESCGAVPGRLESVPNGVGAQVVVDYCHTPDALEKCLLALKAVPHQRILTVFGCGGDRDSGKRPMMGEIALRLSDRAIVTSDNPRTENPQQILNDIETGMTFDKARYVVIPDRREAIKTAVDELASGDILLIAGKGHETYQILGRKKVPFDDRELTRKYLIEAGKGAND